MAHANRGSVLVFGGTGMLGHEVVRALAGDEREVHFTVRTRAPAAKAELPGTPTTSPPARVTRAS